MTIEELQRIHQTKPFRRFVLRLADGSRLEVPHPEFLWLHPRGRTAIVATPDDAFEIVDVLLIAAIEVGDGKPRSRRRKK